MAKSNQTIASVAVRIGADTTELKKGVASGSADLKKLASVGTAAGVALVSAMAAAATAVAAFAIKGVALGDALAKAAQKIGITATELGGLRYAAELSNVSSEALDKSLVKLGKTVSDAKGGLSTANKALTDLGLSFSDLEKMPLSEQMLKVGEALKGVTNQTDKLRLAQDIFGRQGSDLLNLFEQGTDAIRAQMAEAKSYGLYLDRTQSRVVQEAADAQTRMKKSFEGLAIQLGATFGPAIEAASNAIAHLTRWVTQALPKLAALAERFLGIKRAAVDLSDIDLEVTAREWRKELEDVNKEIERMERMRGDKMNGAMRVSLENNLSAAYERQLEAASRLGEVEHERLRRKDAPAPATVVASTDVNGDAKVDEETKTEMMLFDLFKDIEEKKQELRKQEFEQMWSNLQAELDVYAAQEEAQKEHIGNMIEGVLMEVDQMEQAKERKKQILGETVNHLQEFSGMLANHSKKMFALNKAASIAEAIINMHKGISEGVKLGWPQGIPAVAWATAQGLASIAAIKKTQFGGGTTPSAAGTPTVNGNPVQQPQQVITVRGLEPNKQYSGRDMVDLINEAQRNGARLVTQN